MKKAIMFKPLPGAFILVLWVVFSSCSSNEIGNSKDVNPESIYFDYKVWGNEEAGYMTTRLQYRFAGRNGTTLLLEDSVTAALDGEILQADSSRMNGVYYEVIKPISEFAGKHTITFTGINKKQYSEEFTFQPLSLRTDIPAVVKRDDLVFDLDGLEPVDYVQVLLTDTTAFSDGISRIDTVRNGHITITKDQLRDIANGPVHLAFSKDDDRKIKNSTREGGRLSISYILTRDFELKDMADSTGK